MSSIISLNNGEHLAAMSGGKRCELLGPPDRTISREASSRGTFNDYPEREYNSSELEAHRTPQG